MAIQILPVAAGTVMICRKVQKVSKVSEIICRYWPILSGVAKKSINSIVRVLSRMTQLLNGQTSSRAIWGAAKQAIEETLRTNPQFISYNLGQGMTKETAINFFAKLFELLL